MEKVNLENVIDLKELLNLIFRNKIKIFVVTILFSIMGILISKHVQPTYVCSVKAIYESSDSNKRMGGDLGVLAAMAGVSGSSGFDMSSYFADIINSYEFIEPILKMKWQVGENSLDSIKLIDN